MKGETFLTQKIIFGAIVDRGETMNLGLGIESKFDAYVLRIFVLIH